MTKLVKGARIRQIMPAPAEGILMGFEIDKETGDRMVRMGAPVLDKDGKPVMTEDRNGDEETGFEVTKVPVLREWTFKYDEVELVTDDAPQE